MSGIHLSFIIMFAAKTCDESAAFAYYLSLHYFIVLGK